MPHRGFAMMASSVDHPFDVDTDDLIPVAHLCREVLGSPRDIVTIGKWRTGHARFTVKLPACRVSGVWCTTREEFTKFVDAVNLKQKD